MLVVLIVAIQIGALIAHELHPDKIGTLPTTAGTFDSLTNHCMWYALACTAVALAGCVHFLTLSLGQFDLPFTPLGVLEVGARWTMLRYDDVLEPWSVRILVMWFHPAGLLGGVVFACSRRRRDRVLAVATLFPAAAYSVLTAARAPALLGLTCWLGGYLATSCVGGQGRRPALFARKRVGWFLSVAACLVFGFVAVDAVRGVPSINEFQLDPSKTQIFDFMLGSPAAFAAWYAHAEASDPEWGARTFAGVFDLLHLKVRIVGRYTDASNLIGTQCSNIYTSFRGLIEDFSAAGATLVCACLGALAGWLYIKRRETDSLGALFWLSAFYAATVYSPIICLFSFNGALLAWVVASAAMRRATVHTSQNLAISSGVNLARTELLP